MNEFSKVFHEVSQKVSNESRKSNSSQMRYRLDNAIIFWCEELKFSDNITNYILLKQNIPEIEKLIDYLLEHLEKYENEKSQIWFQKILGINRRLDLIQPILQKINRHNNNDNNVIVLFGFVITAIGYCIHLINQPHSPEKKTQKKEDIYPSPSSYQESPPVLPVLSSPVQPLIKQSLILVIAATQESIIESIKINKKIDYGDGEKLYKATKYLYQAKEETIKPQWNTIKQFETQPQEANEYDIYLIKIDLKEANEGFKATVNQLERYDAFNKLYDVATNVEVSSRLKMEAASNFDVYIR